MMTAHRPLVADDYPAIYSWFDVTDTDETHIIPDPNLLVIEATLDVATLAQIEADPDYFVIWSDNA